MTPRTFNPFSDAAEEVVNARVIEGIHFRFADTEREKQADTWPNGHPVIFCSPGMMIAGAHD